MRRANKQPKKVLVNVERARTKQSRATNRAKVAPERTGSGREASGLTSLTAVILHESRTVFPKCVSLSDRKSITIALRFVPPLRARPSASAQHSAARRFFPTPSSPFPHGCVRMAFETLSRTISRPCLHPGVQRRRRQTFPFLLQSIFALFFFIDRFCLLK